LRRKCRRKPTRWTNPLGALFNQFETYCSNSSANEEGFYDEGQPAFSAKTLRAAVLLPAASVGSAVTARCGDAPTSLPWLQPKSLAAGRHGIFRQALSGFRHLSRIPLDFGAKRKVNTMLNQATEQNQLTREGS